MSKKGPKGWIKHAHYYVLIHPPELCAAQSATSTQESTTRLKSNLPSLKSLSLWSHFDEHVGVSMWPVAADEMEKYLQSQQIHLTLIKRITKYQQCHKRTCGCGYFHNDEMGTNKKTVTLPFFFFQSVHT